MINCYRFNKKSSLGGNMPVELTARRRTERRNKWTYCFGGVGRDMAYQLFNAWLFTFILLTNTVTLAQQLTLTAIFITCKVWDGFNDPIMGFIIEKTRTRYGKFHLDDDRRFHKLHCPYGIFTQVCRHNGWAYIAFISAMYLLVTLHTMNI